MSRAIVTSSSSTDAWALHHLPLLLLLLLSLYSMSNFVQTAVVDWLAHIFDGSLRVGWGNDLVLPGQPVWTVGAFVGGENPDLSPGHLLLVDADSLADVVDLGLHLADGGGLQVEHLEEVVGKSVDLVGHACKRLCCVTYCKEKSYQSNIQFSLKTLGSLIFTIPIL